jgi:hypothetical protein
MPGEGKGISRRIYQNWSPLIAEQPRRSLTPHGLETAISGIVLAKRNDRRLPLRRMESCRSLRNRFVSLRIFAVLEKTI